MNHECSICFEHIDKNDVFHTGICIHVYHNECIFLWYKNCQKKQFSCPLCRTIIPSKNILKNFLTFHEKITIIINNIKESIILPIFLTLLGLYLHYYMISYIIYNPIYIYT
jgi:hypothetical protein